MTVLNHKFAKSLAFLIGILSLAISPAVSYQTRHPVYAGSFYPKSPEELTALLKNYSEIADHTPVLLPEGATLRALILPHAGYIYSGLTAAHSSKVLKNNDYKKIIIMGPDHRVGFTNCAITDAKNFITPLGSVDVHSDGLYLKQKFKNMFRSVKKSDDMEHSIEVQIPFLQHYLKDFQIVPIVMGPGDIKKYSEAIETVIDRETLIIVSSDLSHYLSYDQAVNTDQRTIDQILTMDINELSKNRNKACGIIPIQVLTHIALRNRWDPILLHYSNSGDTAGSKDRVVGYAAVAYFETSEKNIYKGKNHMDKEKGSILLKLARKTIADSLDIEINESDIENGALSDNIFKEQRGTFVTLTINNQLRGCIGNLSADKSIIEGVMDNAVNAAFHDPRFPPLSKQELEHTDIEISLLSDPEKLEYSDGDDLLNKLRPNIDGVIIRKGPYSSTFLPQVWEQLPDKKSFLEHLCQKAGLPPDEWRRPGIEVMVYQVQYFEENH